MGVEANAVNGAEVWAETLYREIAQRHGRARRMQATATERADLLAWCRRFLPEHFRLPPSRMHQVVAAELVAMSRRRGGKLNVLAPRGSAKSTLASLGYPLWAVLEGGERYVWLVSDGRRQARAHLENIAAELEENRALRREYPRIRRLLCRRADRVTLEDGATWEAFGTGQAMRGKRRRMHRPTLIVADDLQSERHMLSPRLRERTRLWFHGTLSAAGTPETNFVHLATALHGEALGMELTRAPGWRSWVFRALERPPQASALWAEWERIYHQPGRREAVREARRFYLEHREAMDAGASVLWPQREDLYALMCLRAEIGAAAFAREKQNSPVSPEYCEWPDDYFADHVWCETPPGRALWRVAALDPSKGSEGRRGDYSALVLAAETPDGALYVEADLARRSVAQMVEDAADWCSKHGVQAFGVEANQFQELLAEPLMRAFRARGLVSCAPWLIRNHIPKQVRIRRLGPLLAARRLRFRRDSPGTRLLVEQLRMFPLAEHDDGPDALEMALRLAEEWTRPHPGERIVGRIGW
ncbi:phage terminase large subunit [Thermopirellula anaerolimosa]